MNRELKRLLRSSESKKPYQKAIPKVLEGLLGHDNAQEHKYHAHRCQCLYKHWHDSKKEAMWCVKLHELQKEGKIRNLSCEPIYDLRVNGVVICRHIPDFDYEIPFNGDDALPRPGWKVEVLDVKGFMLPEWKLKHKLFCAIYSQINYVVV